MTADQRLEQRLATLAKNLKQTQATAIASLAAAVAALLFFVVW